MLYFRILFCLVAISTVSCGMKHEGEAFPSIPGYDLNNPVIIHLKTELDEISGIAYYPFDSSLFAINDELGVLYKIYLRDRIVIKKWKFSDASDYEDIQLRDSLFYILQSNGTLQQVSFIGKDSVQSTVFNFPFEGHFNFESIYFDSDSNRLITICKNCPSENKNATSAFAFNLADHTWSPQPAYKLKLDKIANLLHQDYVKFKTSAAAIHPITKELYIISSVEKMLVIADQQGNAKKAVPLDPAFFKQPEGIAFSPKGDLFISNESAETGSPNILVYTYKPALNEKN